MTAKFRIKSIIKLGIKSLWMHQLRSVLTMLGIIFGVCSVVAMLAVGEGASRESQDQIARLGSQNIIIKTVKPPQEQNTSGKSNSLQQYGLTYADVERVRSTIPNVEMTVPLRRFNQEARFRTRKVGIEIIGTVPSYSQAVSLFLREGRFFSQLDQTHQKEVCVMEEDVARNLFFSDDPLGKDVKIANDYYRVIGVTGTEDLPKEDSGDKAAKSKPPVNIGKGIVGKIYIPLNVVRTRFGELGAQFGGGSGLQLEKVELQELIVKVHSLEQVLPTREILEGLFGQFHSRKDYQIVVPLELLRQAMRTKRIFSIVLGSIAAISLLVGGIGIMNIMLATVSERTREIGIRRALGAKRRDIIIQFLSETVILSMTGGILGILLGSLLPFLVTYFFEMPTVVTGISLILAFGISGIVGVSFGLYPAYRAATMDPIESLRHE